MNVGCITRSAGRLFMLAVCSCTTFTLMTLCAQRPTPRPSHPQSTTQSEQIIAQLWEAASLLENGRATEAEPVLRRVLAANPNNFDAHNLLGIVLDQAGKTNAAEREYKS